jgi:hypothetical protein
MSGPGRSGLGAIARGPGPLARPGALRRHRRPAKLETELVRTPFLDCLTGLGAGTDH